MLYVVIQNEFAVLSVFFERLVQFLAVLDVNVPISLAMKHQNRCVDLRRPSQRGTGSHNLVVRADKLAHSLTIEVISSIPNKRLRISHAGNTDETLVHPGILDRAH